MRSMRYGGMLVLAGTLLNSLSAWVLIWLFAQTSGGPAAVGVYGRLLAFATPLFVACELGLRVVFVSSSARWPWRTYSRLRLAGNLLGTVVMLIYLLLENGSSLLLGLAILAFKISNTVLDLQYARLQFGGLITRLGWLSIANAVVTIVFAIAVVDITGEAASGVFGSAFVSLATAFWAWIYGRHVLDPPTACGSGLKEVLAAGSIVTASRFLATLLFQLPILLLGIFADDAVVGVFVGAAYLITAANQVGATLQTVLVTPLRLAYVKGGVEKVRAAIGRVTRQSLWWGLVGVAVVIVFGSDVLTLLYGPGFAQSRASLALLAVGALSSVIAYIHSTVLNVLNRYSGVTLANGISCIAVAAGGTGMLMWGLDATVAGPAMVAVGGLARAITSGRVAARLTTRSRFDGY